MGATFDDLDCEGNSIKEAYESAVKQAVYDDGHCPYNGTISTTKGFKEIECPEGWVEFGLEERCKFFDSLMEECEKWGPALGFKSPEGGYTFVFWAAM